MIEIIIKHVSQAPCLRASVWNPTPDQDKAQARRCFLTRRHEGTKAYSPHKSRLSLVLKREYIRW